MSFSFCPHLFLPCALLGFFFDSLFLGSSELERCTVLSSGGAVIVRGLEEVACCCTLLAIVCMLPVAAIWCSSVHRTVRLCGPLFDHFAITGLVLNGMQLRVSANLEL